MQRGHVHEPFDAAAGDGVPRFLPVGGIRQGIAARGGDLPGLPLPVQNHSRQLRKGKQPIVVGVGGDEPGLDEALQGGNQAQAQHLAHVPHPGPEPAVAQVQGIEQEIEHPHRQRDQRQPAKALAAEAAAFAQENPEGQEIGPVGEKAEHIIEPAADLPAVVVQHPAGEGFVPEMQVVGENPHGQQDEQSGRCPEAPAKGLVRRAIDPQSQGQQQHREAVHGDVVGIPQQALRRKGTTYQTVAADLKEEIQQQGAGNRAQQTPKLPLGHPPADRQGPDQGQNAAEAVAEAVQIRQFVEQNMQRPAQQVGPRQHPENPFVDAAHGITSRLFLPLLYMIILALYPPKMVGKGNNFTKAYLSTKYYQNWGGAPPGFPL